MRIVLIGCAAQLSHTATAQPVWIDQFGSVGVDAPQSACLDGSGALFLAGDTDRDLAAPNANQAGDIWFARYTTEGQRQWIRQFGTPDREHVRGVCSDGGDGFFACGQTNGDYAGPPIDGWDAWFGRYDASGDPVWLRPFGTQEQDYGTACASDDAGGVYIAGRTGGRLSLTPSAGGDDAFVARFDGSGDQIWILQIGTSRFDQASGLAADGSGGVFVCGTTDGGLGPTAHPRTDAWVGRIAGDGTRLWTAQLGSAGDDYATGITADGLGGLLVAGWTTGDIAKPVSGATDAWLARYSESGELLWVRQLGNCGSERGFAVTADGQGRAYLAGDTFGDLRSTNVGESDAFLTGFDAGGRRSSTYQLGSAREEIANVLVRHPGGGIIASGNTVADIGGPNAGARDVWIGRFQLACDADCDGSGSLDIFDFVCFQDAFTAGDPYADCAEDCVLDIFDFVCFQDEFISGCP